MEDARIKSGNGTVDRSTTHRSSGWSGTPRGAMTASQYIARRRALAPGGELHTEMERLRAQQAPWKKNMEEQIARVVAEEQRHQ